MYFLIVFKLLFEKTGGGIFGDHNFTLWRPKIYTWSPVGACIKKLISDPAFTITHLQNLKQISKTPRWVILIINLPENFCRVS